MNPSVRNKRKKSFLFLYLANRRTYYKEAIKKNLLFLFFRELLYVQSFIFQAAFKKKSFRQTIQFILDLNSLFLLPSEEKHQRQGRE